MSLSFPARFMLAAAMNPCPCGYFNDKSRDCTCTPPMIQRYVAKVSGPLLDRIDIHIEVPAVQYQELRGGSAAEGSAEIRARVLAARERQHARFAAAAERTKARRRLPPSHLRQRADEHPADSCLLPALLRRRAAARARHAAAGPQRPRPRPHPEGLPHHRRPRRRAGHLPSNTSPKPSSTARSTAATGHSPQLLGVVAATGRSVQGRRASRDHATFARPPIHCMHSTSAAAISHITCSIVTSLSRRTR